MFNFDAKFFDEHQKGLLYIANNRYLRWLLGLNRLPKPIRNIKIDKITPNSVHTIVNLFNKNGKAEIKITGYFFSRYRFAEALAYNLSPFIYFQNFRTGKRIWRLSPVGLICSLLLIFWPKHFGGFYFFGTTTSYYSDTGYVDGGIGRNNGSGTTWATLRAGAGTTVRNDLFIYAYHPSSGNSYQWLFRGIFCFDTSGIGSDSTISSATFNLTCSTKNDNAGLGTSDLGFNLVASTPASTSSLANSDFSNVGTTVFGTIAYGTFNTDNSTYVNCSLNADGLANISKTGISKFGHRMYADLSDTDPGATSNSDSRIVCNYSDVAGTSKDPYLSVTYSAIATFIPKIIIC